ncbi:MAG: hypothetical protein IJW67_07120 [Blautia sp.]|nr:hypothetical protein [Blautia sp.]
MISFISMSLTGGILILLISILRAFSGKYLPKRLFVCLWIVVILRLLLPLSIPVSVRFSVDFGKFFTTEKIAEVPYIQPQNQVVDRIPVDRPLPEKTILQKLSNILMQKSAPSLRGWILSVLWFTGAVGTAVFFWIRSREEREVIKQSIPMSILEKTNLFRQAEEFSQGSMEIENFGFDCRGKPLVHFAYSDRICTPVAAGILRKKVIFPRTFSMDGSFPIIYVLLHEMVHIRRRDNLVKLLAITAVCLHWFNPAVWIFLQELTWDMELSCDQKVLAMTGESHRKPYAEALLMLAAQESSVRMLSSGFGERELRERLVTIMKYRKFTKITGVVAGVILLLSLGAFVQASQAQPGRQGEQGKQTEQDVQENQAEQGTQGMQTEDGEQESQDEQISQGKQVEAQEDKPELQATAEESLKNEKELGNDEELLSEEEGMFVEYTLEKEEDWQLLDILDFSIDGATLSFRAALHDLDGKRPYAAKDHVYVNDQDCRMELFSEDPGNPGQYLCYVDLTANEETWIAQSELVHVSMKLYMSENTIDDIEPFDFTVHLFADGTAWREMQPDQTVQLPDGGIVEVKE